MGDLDRGEVIAAYRRWYPQYSPADVFFAATTASRSWRGQVIEAERRAERPASASHTWVYQLDWPAPIDGGKWGAHHGLGNSMGGFKGRNNAFKMRKGAKRL